MAVPAAILVAVRLEVMLAAAVTGTLAKGLPAEAALAAPARQLLKIGLLRL